MVIEVSLLDAAFCFFPPVQLIHTAEGYVVRDGHHRLSVARAFGQAVIEAEIV
jgi:hypothetical protein